MTNLLSELDMNNPNHPDPIPSARGSTTQQQYFPVSDANMGPVPIAHPFWAQRLKAKLKA